MDRLWEYRQIFEKFSHNEKVSILTENDQDIPEGHDPTAQVNRKNWKKQFFSFLKFFLYLKSIQINDNSIF